MVDPRVPPQVQLDPVTADRLLDGRLPADDAPPGYATVATLLRDLAAPVDATAAARAWGVDALLAGPCSAPIARHAIRWSRRTVGAALLAFGATGAVAAAAATGVLPGTGRVPTPAVTTSSVAGAPGAPPAGAPAATAPTTRPGADASTTTAAPTTSTVAPGPARAVGPDASGPAHDGLCRAMGARTEPPGRSVAAANLAQAAEDAGQSVAEFCGEAGGAATSSTSTTSAPTPGRSGSAPGRQRSTDTAAAPSDAGPPDDPGSTGKGRATGRD